MSNEFPGAGGGDSYTEVTHQNWFQRMASSVMGGVLGFVFFLASFGVTFWNEGLADFSKIAANAVAVDAAAPSEGAVGKFVAATGKLDTDAKLGDKYLKKGNYVALTRKAEMYAWVEHETSRTEKKVGGGETTIKEYSYDKQWTSSPESTSSFKKQAGHRNPSMDVKEETFKANEATVGKLRVNVATITLPSGTAVELTDENTKGGETSGGYLYVGKADASDPDVGDVRLAYEAVKPGGEVTVLGQLQNTSTLAPYAAKETTFYRMFDGGRQAALDTMSTENTMRLWGLRLLGFCLCWFGMLMMLEPLNTFLDLLPFLGSMGRGLSGFATFPIALVLTITTMIVSWIVHNIFLMILIGVIVLAVCAKLFGSKAVGAARQAAKQAA